ncbi:hypothetical protein AAE478_002643 [Parahypoxylon ruwenzoriense]
MNFSILPNELAHAILVAAVKVRGAKRALRLRLVSQSWSIAILHAIFESGILDDPELRPWYAPIWPRYLAYRVMHVEKPLTRPLLIIRRVAERVLAFRGGENSDDTLRNCVSELCQLVPRVNRCSPDYAKWLLPTRPAELRTLAESIVEDDEDFKQTLLTAAAWTNEVEFVKELLPRVQECHYLISQDGVHEMNPILGYPLDVAAFKGNTEVVRILLKDIALSDEDDLGRSSALEYAGEGNQLGTLELCLEPEYTEYDMFLATALESTTSTEVFERLFGIAKDFINKEHGRPGFPDFVNTSFLPGMFRHAVQHGAVPLTEHLITLGLSPDGDWIDDGQRGRPDLVSVAAERGHYDMVAYLLEKGFRVGSDSIKAAAKHGNRRIVRLLLDHGVQDVDGWESALTHAAERENEPVFRLLMESGATIDQNTKGKVLQMAGEQGLESIAKLVKEYI